MAAVWGRTTNPVDEVKRCGSRRSYPLLLLLLITLNKIIIVNHHHDMSLVHNEDEVHNKSLLQLSFVEDEHSMYLVQRLNVLTNRNACFVVIVEWRPFIQNQSHIIINSSPPHRSCSREAFA